MVTTVLQIKGINIVGNSILLNDVNLHILAKRFYFHFEHKKNMFFLFRIFNRLYIA